ncbi:hypothetical protein DL96DRAFT_78835 [Flagelloscypha sp. PMI_526]|nr:hypothetical protein DL96DRAFT_78835 [Flagelloscypha sp. PMI_526]
MDSRSSSPSPMLAVLHAPESPDLPLSSSANKRRRDPSPPPSAALFEDETAKEKTRRVNPYRLAERLGSDLVAELEAFIYPGAKMPSYNERKVVQDKYLVDRRHIYDYLHSRGLRVAKEDRHLNLYRNRMQQGPRTTFKET